jgi:hypothetical protein
LVVGADGRFVQVGSVREGDRVLTTIESSGVVLMERVDKVKHTKHVISTVVGLCVAESKEQVRQSFAAGSADECVIVSSNHGVAVKLNEASLASISNAPEVVALLRSVLQVVDESEREELAVRGRAFASFDSSRETFLPAGDLVKLIEYLKREERVDDGMRIAALHDVGLMTVDMTGSISSRRSTFVVWGLTRVPKSLEEWVGEDGLLTLVQFEKRSSRQDVAPPAANLNVSSAAIARARHALGLEHWQSLCLPGPERTPLDGRVLVSVADGTSMTTTDCNATTPGTLEMSRLVGGDTVLPSDWRGELVAPLEPGSPSVNDEAAIAAAGDAVVTQQAFLEPCAAQGANRLRNGA